MIWKGLGQTGTELDRASQLGTLLGELGGAGSCCSLSCPVQYWTAKGEFADGGEYVDCGDVIICCGIALSTSKAWMARHS